MRTQKIRLFAGGSLDVYIKNKSLFYNQALYPISPYPAWLTDLGVLPLQILQITGVPAGTYTIDLTEGSSPPTVDARLIIEAVATLAESVDTCYKTGSVCLVWITREGGRASYIFDQRKDTGGTLGNGQKFDNGGSTKWVNRGKSYSTRTVYKTGLSHSEVDLIESLRQSIQAWEYDVDTDTSTEIELTPENYNTGTTKDKLKEVNIKYRLATYKEVQNQ